MNPYNNFSVIYSSGSQYDPNPYQFHVYQNSYPHHHHQINAYQLSPSCYPYTYPSHKLYNNHTLQNPYIHDDQPLPSQVQSTQSSKLHALLLQIKKEISTVRDRIDKQMAKENALDSYDKGETYDEEGNPIIDLSNKEERSKMNNQGLSHQTSLKPIIKNDCNSRYNDGVICKRDGDMLSFSFKNIEENSEVSNLDCTRKQYPLDYFENNFTPHHLGDRFHYGDGMISKDRVSMFDEETEYALIEDVIPNPITQETLDTETEGESDSHDLKTKDYDLDQSFEKNIEEHSTMLSTTCCIPVNAIQDESQLLEKLNYEHNDPCIISTLNEYTNPPIFSNAHEVIDCEIKENKSMMSDSHVLEDMTTISNLGSTKRNVGETPISSPIIPHTSYYQVYDENIILEDMRYEYHDPFLIKRDTDHPFHISLLSCMHHLFTTTPKMFSFTFIITKRKHYKKIILKEKLNPGNLSYNHWEDDFPIFILIYALD